MEPTKQSGCNHVCQKCGGEADSYTVGGHVFYRALCKACEQIRDAEIERRRADETGRQSRAEISRRIGLTIPRLFFGAEISNLPEALQSKIDGLSADRGLFLFGPVGCGKSYAMAAIVKERIQGGVWPVMLLNWERFLGWLRSTYNGEAGEADRILLRVMKSAALGLDDLCVGDSESEFSLKTLYSILDYRIENCLPTFFAANRSPNEIGKAFDQRITSRILGSCEVVCLAGQDRRAKR